MEPNTFDGLVKQAGTARLTRMQTLRGLAAGALAVVTGAALVSSDADAKKKRKGKGKAKGKRPSGRSRALNSQGVPTTCEPTCTTPTKSQQRFPGGPPPAGCFRIGGTGDRFQLPSNGCVTYTDPSCGCSTEFCVTPNSKGEPYSLSFKPKGTLGCTVSTVTVKGGTDQIVYSFKPASLCGSGLISPKNNGGNVAAISHIDVCGVGCCQPLKCKKDGGTIVCTDGPICNTCGGTVDCPCDDNDKCTVDTCNVKEQICIFKAKCEDKDGGCQVASCDPRTGDCSWTPLCPDKPGCITSCSDAECSYKCDTGCTQCSPGGYGSNNQNSTCRYQLSGYSPGDPHPCIAEGVNVPAACNTFGKAINDCQGPNNLYRLQAAAFLNQSLPEGCDASAAEICSLTQKQLEPLVVDVNCPSKNACEN